MNYFSRINKRTYKIILMMIYSLKKLKLDTDFLALLLKIIITFDSSGHILSNFVVLCIDF